MCEKSTQLHCDPSTRPAIIGTQIQGARFYQLTKASNIAAALLVGLLANAPGFAQDEAEGNQPELDRTMVCMSGALPDVARNAARDRGTPIEILVIRSDTGEMAKKGFTPRPCEQTMLAEDDQRQIYRDWACNLAAKGNEAVQNQLEDAIGVRPAALCSSAELAIGPWVRQRTVAQTEPEGE